MKQIALKVVDVVIQDKPVKLSYKNQLREIFRSPSDPRGADLEEVRHSIHILDALEKADGVLQLEDADFEYMKRRVQTARWQVVDRFVLAFVEDVTKEQ